MQASTRRIALAVAIVSLAAAGTAWSQDQMATVTHRQDVMKGQGKHLTAIKGYLGGKVDKATATTDAADLVASIKTIPTLFPKDSGMAQFPGKSYAKPVIWSEPDKFSAAQQNALAKAETLAAAMKNGDKAKIQAAFVDLGKNGCGGCHTTFREPKKS